MSRLTREKDKWECRVSDCYAEDWMHSLYGKYPDLNDNICEDCPFVKVINRLAEYEDLVEESKEYKEVTLNDFRKINGNAD